MDRIFLDNSHVPLHYQVADYLIDMLQRGDLVPDMRVPPEEELTRLFGVSRTTIRRSLEHLTAKGLVVRKQGKGTFWTDKARNVQPHKLTGINRQIFNINETTTVNVLSKTTERGTEAARRFLGVAQEEQVVVFKRVRYAAGAPMSYTVNYIRQEWGRLITPGHLKRMTMLEALETVAGVNIGTIEHEVEVARASAEIAQHLSVPVLDPVLSIQTSVFDTGEAPVEIVWTSFVENKYKFKVVL